MIFSHPKKKIDYSVFNLQVNGTPSTDSFKYLGLVLDSSLSWSEHIKCISKKIAAMIGALRKASPHLHSRTPLSVYYAEIHSIELLMGISFKMSNEQIDCSPKQSYADVF